MVGRARDHTTPFKWPLRCRGHHTTLFKWITTMSGTHQDPLYALVLSCPLVSLQVAHIAAVANQIDCKGSASYHLQNRLEAI